jgi:hypothetical protein
VYEALDYFVSIKLNVSPDDPDGEMAVLRDSAIQAELERQVRDITDLSEAGDLLSHEAVAKLRQRSTTEQALQPPNAR